jgi:hypothetical protein
MSVHDIDGAPVHRLNYNGLLILTEDFAHGGGDFAYGGVAFYSFENDGHKIFSGAGVVFHAIDSGLPAEFIAALAEGLQTFDLLAL